VHGIDVFWSRGWIVAKAEENCQNRHKNKDWVRMTLSHRQGQAVPYYFDFSPPAQARAEGHYGCPIEDTLTFPIRMAGCKSIKPLYADPDEFGETAEDEFGVLWSTNKLDRGQPVRPPLSDPDLSGYAFPDPTASYRFDDIGDWCQRNRQDYTIIWVGDLWERATFVRGMENILVDLAYNPTFVDRLLAGLADYVIATMEILFERFQFDAIAVSDDYGTQNSLLMSPADWRRHIKPHLTEIYALAKRSGRAILHHSDGNIRAIIGDMIDIGCDILHPVQPETMDVFDLKRQFGRDLTFFGAVHTQHLLPFGTPEDVRNEVRTLKREMGADGGYVISNGITIQSDVPLNNLTAMIDEARKPS